MIAGSLQPASAQARTEKLSVHTDQVLVTNFMGFGVQLDPYEYRPDDVHWQEITHRLDDLHPAFLRVMFDAKAYCLRADSHGCAQYLWKQDTVRSDHYEQILRILDYAESRHTPVMIGEWTWPRLPHDANVPAMMGPDDPRWAEIIAPFLVHLTRDLHYSVLRFYNYMNEPNGGWMWPGGRAGVNYAAWKKGYIHARHVFNAAGLQNIALVGPDNSGDWNWIDDAVRDTANVTGGWEMHWYPTDEEVASGAVYTLLRQKKGVINRGDPASRSKPVFLGEAGLITGRVNGDQQPRVRSYEYGVRMADLAAQIAQAGWMGASAWDLDDAMHTVKGDVPVVPGPLTLKTWGFWNSEGDAMGQPDDFNIRPWFKVWSLLAHSFPPGSRILQVSDPESPTGVRSIASQRSVNPGSLSVLLVNDHESAVNTVLHVPAIPNTRWILFRYTPDDRSWSAADSGSPMKLEPGNSIRITVMPNSVNFLVARAK